MIAILKTVIRIFYERNLDQYMAHKRKKRRFFLRRLFFFGFPLITLAALFYYLMPLFMPHSPAADTPPATGQSHLSLSALPEPAASPLDLSQLYSPHSILLNAENGEILAAYQDDSRIYPASLTKLMTALLLVESGEDLDQSVVIPDWIFDDLYAQDASLAGFDPGEEVCLRDLLYGILLPSGAECCLTAAQAVAGTEEAFIELMNSRAQELSMNDTHFSNTTGLHAADHYTTVQDLALLLRYALQNNTFREALLSQYYSVAPTEMHPDGFTFYSTLSESMQNAELSAPEILGGKTGYTDEAGLCLASLAKISDQEYLLVTAGAAGSHETPPYHILDAISVYRQLAS
jgi:D-alanyl-D-alanine carboxypeptidase (penicillin-binding protein 5/6)